MVRQSLLVSQLCESDGDHSVELMPAADGRKLSYQTDARERKITN